MGLFELVKYYVGIVIALVAIPLYVVYIAFFNCANPRIPPYSYGG